MYQVDLLSKPSLEYNDEIVKGFLVDGKGDGGLDAILLDPNNDEASDLILCQAKHWKNISKDEISDAVHKMIDLYKDLDAGHTEVANPNVSKKFTQLNSEVGDESKVHFVFYTSAPKNRIDTGKLKKIISDEFSDTEKYDLEIYFDENLIELIKQTESRRPCVEKGELVLDRPHNILKFDDDSAAIVNISAASLKELYTLNSTNLLAKNLRYFVKNRPVDEGIKDTIKQSSKDFWYKNNGLTIICRDYDCSGNILKLYDFSIVNGGQTTTIIARSEYIGKDDDFYLPCKVIKIQGDSEKERDKFVLDIATATNAQKAIKPIDLKSNSPEQLQFAGAMKDVGIHYVTKRGETIPPGFSEWYKNSDLAEVGKLCLAGIFQMPAASRTKPSTLYHANYYDRIFDSNKHQVAKIVSDLLYVDYYYRKKFISKYEEEHLEEPQLSFARVARTTCIAFTALSSRVAQKNITKEKINTVFKHIGKDDTCIYDIFKELDNVESIFSKDYIDNNGLDAVDRALYQLFSIFIKEGYKLFVSLKRQDPTLNETNFLKKDQNYYSILEASWLDLKEKILELKEIFSK